LYAEAQNGSAIDLQYIFIKNEFIDKSNAPNLNSDEEVKLWFTPEETYDYEDLNEKYTRGNW
jgi:hypothetical protein